MFSSFLICSPFSPQIFSNISSFTHHTIHSSSPHLPLLPPTSASSKHLTTLSFHLTPPLPPNYPFLAPTPPLPPFSSPFFPLTTPYSHLTTPSPHLATPSSHHPSFLLPPLPPSSSLTLSPHHTTLSSVLASPHLFFLLSTLRCTASQQYVIFFKNLNNISKK
jgi:hypothetical protein